MKKFSPSSFNYRESVYVTILICYLLPILIFSKHSVSLMPPNKSWGVISIGLMISVLGSALLILLVNHWEQSLRRKWLLQERVAGSTGAAEGARGGDDLNEENQNKITPLHLESDALSGQESAETFNVALIESEQHKQPIMSELNSLNEQLRQLYDANGQYKQQLDKAQREFEEYRQSSDALLTSARGELTEARQANDHLRGQLEEKERLVTELESKNRDLSYEVKTLLELEDKESASAFQGNPAAAHPFHPVISTFSNEDDLSAVATEGIKSASSERKVRTSYDAVLELQRCIDQARNMKGAAHLSEGGRLGTDNYAIDLRRLFDKFRHETSSPILLYCPDAEKVLFASNQIKGLLGWSPEKFAHDFFNLLQEGGDAWRAAAKNLDGTNHQRVTMVMKTCREGSDALVHCYINKISGGPFANNVIGVLMSA